MKFSSKSKFSTQEYKGHYVPWCLGGYGYVISFSAVRKILFEAINFNDQPYEDLLIAKLLKKKGIHPKNVEDLRDYICSPVHR